MVIHCIKCGILELTKSKIEDLNHEYEGFQWWMQFGIDKDILSQHKRAKGHKYKKNRIHYKDYSLVIPYRQVRYRNKDTKLTQHWIKISVRKRKGIGVWLPIKPHKKLKDFKYLKDSLLLKNHKSNYEIRLIFDVPQQLIKPKNILAIDLGERTIATVCDSLGNRFFLGKDIRGIRRHYAWLRKELGKRKLLNKIKKIGHKEKNIVRNRLHHISNEIIEKAKETESMIVIGNLTRPKKKRSKFLNGIIFNMPFYTLTKMIKYKAEQNGLQVKMIDESYTSITCHSCGNIEKKQRKSQGLFVCSHCGLQYNADLNATRNISIRAEEQGFLAGAISEAHKSLENEEVIGSLVCS